MKTLQKENTNNILATIEKTLLDIRANKEFSKNKVSIINGLLELANKLFTEQGDKGGYLRLLFAYDKEKGWSNPSDIKSDIIGYFDFVGVDYHFNAKKQKLMLDFSDAKKIDFIEYRKLLADNKKADKEKTNAELLKINLPFNLEKLTSEQLKACILKANLKLKALASTKK